MTDAVYVVTSLVWAVYGLAFGFASGVVVRLISTQDRK